MNFSWTNYNGEEERNCNRNEGKFLSFRMNHPLLRQTKRARNSLRSILLSVCFRFDLNLDSKRVASFSNSFILSRVSDLSLSSIIISRGGDKIASGKETGWKEGAKGGREERRTAFHSTRGARRPTMRTGRRKSPPIRFNDRTNGECDVTLGDR